MTNDHDTTDATETTGRTLVLCFDGTASQFMDQNTNVVKFCALLHKGDAGRQLVYYQSGIGTYARPGVLNPAARWAAKTIDLAVAWFLDAHVCGGYEFLMQHYEPGDRICLLGFSRGAYTVRALAGMIHKVGLLPRGNFAQVPFAYKMYARQDAHGFAQSRAFRETFCTAVPIAFVGLWDTVASVGTVRPRRLPFTASNSTVRVVRHALALDERRARFRPSLWAHPRVSADSTPASPAPVSPASGLVSLPELPSEPSAASLVSPPASPPVATPSLPAIAPATSTQSLPAVIPSTPKSIDGLPRARGPISDMKLRRERALEKQFDEARRARRRQDRDRKNSDHTDVLEVWFAGCHGDVGGMGDAGDDGLGRIALLWMVREAVRVRAGIVWDRKACQVAGVPISMFEHEAAVASSAPAVAGLGLESSVLRPAGGPLAADEGALARGRVHDTLLEMSGLWWWPIELLPGAYDFQDDDGRWVCSRRPNLARGRRAGVRPFVHESVRMKMEADPSYRPKAIYKGDPVWVS